MATPPIDFSEVSLRFDTTPVLTDISWQVSDSQRWVIIGPNGSGKTSLLRLAGAWLRPSDGVATVLGERLGKTDVRVLRRSIGYPSQSLTDQLRPAMTPREVVVAGRNAALETWWHRYSDDDWADADARLRRFGVDEAMAARALRTLSSGERQRVLLARAFSQQPGLVVLDEPTAGLDVGGREDLLARIDREAQDSAAPIVMVTHHLEEVPPSTTHALLLKDGQMMASGTMADVVDSASLSALFGVSLTVAVRDGRWSAIAA